MPEYDPKSFGDRLKGEMDARGWDVRRLQQELHSTTGGVRGTSYSAVWSYVNGSGPTDPRRNVIEALADLFGVTPEYLLYNGPRTRLEAKAQRAAPEATEGDEDFYTRFRENMPVLAYLVDDLDRSIEGQALALAVRYVAAQRRLGLSEDDRDEDVFMAVCGFLNGMLEHPLNMWQEQLGRVLHMDGEMFKLYASAMLQALRLSLEAAVPRHLTRDKLDNLEPLQQED